MRIIVTRIDAKRYSTVVERDDGVQLSVPGYGFMRALPHDLAHYIVEATLRLERGFWGSIATGAKLRGMQLLRGRQKPHTDERSREIEKANASFANEAEALVACFEALSDENSAPTTERLKKAQAMFRRQARCPTGSEIAETQSAWSAMQARWDRLPVGETIELDWPARAVAVR
jgi:hypothetical protein